MTTDQGPGPQLQSCGDGSAENFSLSLWSEYNPNWIIHLSFWKISLNFLILLTITIMSGFYGASNPEPYSEAFTHEEIHF